MGGREAAVAVLAVVWSTAIPSPSRATGSPETPAGVRGRAHATVLLDGEASHRSYRIDVRVEGEWLHVHEQIVLAPHGPLTLAVPDYENDDRRDERYVQAMQDVSEDLGPEARYDAYTSAMRALEPTYDAADWAVRDVTAEVDGKKLEVAFHNWMVGSERWATAWEGGWVFAVPADATRVEVTYRFPAEVDGEALRATLDAAPQTWTNGAEGLEVEWRPLPAPTALHLLVQAEGAWRQDGERLVFSPGGGKLTRMQVGWPAHSCSEDTKRGQPPTGVACAGFLEHGWRHRKQGGGYERAALRRARNLVYARRGRPFGSAALRDFFESQPWYTADADYTDARLTEEDRLTIRDIRRLEAPYRRGPGARMANPCAADGWLPTLVALAGHGSTAFHRIHVVREDEATMHVKERIKLVAPHEPLRLLLPDSGSFCSEMDLWRAASAAAPEPMPRKEHDIFRDHYMRRVPGDRIPTDWTLDDVLVRIDGEHVKPRFLNWSFGPDMGRGEGAGGFEFEVPSEAEFVEVEYRNIAYTGFDWMVAKVDRAPRSWLNRSSRTSIIFSEIDAPTALHLEVTTDGRWRQEADRVLVQPRNGRMERVELSWTLPCARARTWNAATVPVSGVPTSTCGGEGLARLWDWKSSALNGCFDPEALRRARNWVFARHGRPFQAEDLQRFFEAEPWYRPDPSYDDDRLTAEDRATIEAIQQLEVRPECAGPSAPVGRQP